MMKHTADVRDRVILRPPGAQTRPEIFGFFYLAVTLLLFQFGPMRYPAEGRLWALAYVLLCFACIWFGYQRGIKQTVYISNIKNTNLYIAGGAVLSLLALWPSAEAYTGRSPFEVLDALANQSETYSQLGEQLAATEGSRASIVALRMFTQPFAYAAIPLSIVFWDRGKVPKVAFTLAAGSYLVFSILRGTDREIADLLVLIGSATFVRIMRGRLEGKPRAKIPTKRIGAAVLALIIVLGAFSAFTSRKEGRLGNISEFCMDASGACSDYRNPLVVALPDSQKFSVAMATAYFTNGYYGLQLALPKPWEPMFGLGHSAGLLRIYESLGGDRTHQHHSYQYRGVGDGWPSNFFWSSMVTSLANDVSFVGALVLLVVFGLVWSRSWLNATYGFNDAAAVVFCVCMQTVFYFPANLQVLQTIDGYATVVFWLIAWANSSRKRR